MTRKKLKQYKALKREIAGLDRAIDKLREQALDVPTVLGKVRGSSNDFPYIEEHITVQMDEPREADAINKRMQIKRKRKEECEKLALEIERFIQEIPDSTDRQIFELTFLEGMKQREVADMVGYSRPRIAQKISGILQD